MTAVAGGGNQYNTVVRGGMLNAPYHGDVNNFIVKPAYRLEPFSYVPVMDVERLVDQPSRLLDARNQIVAFSGREQELAALAQWRDNTDGARLSAILLHGPGGQGKSRLAAHFAECSVAAGWGVVQARHSSVAEAETPATSAVRAGTSGLLVIVDYADRWAHTELVSLFHDPLLTGPTVRVVLIGRTVQWWIAMRGELRSVGAGVDDLLLREFAGSLSAREQAFRAARDRFGEVLRVPVPITETVRGHLVPRCR